MHPHGHRMQELDMIRTNSHPHAPAVFKLHFPSLTRARAALSFPCDARGAVPLDTLSERTRNDYLYARALMGRDYGAPTVLPSPER
jgi:hypothetical protein